MRLSRCKGFSLVEALTALAVVAVVVSAAAPGFAASRREAALTASVNALLGALHFARSTAILTNTPTIVCLSADGVRCADRAAGSSLQGWLVFRNVDRELPPTLGRSDELLRQADFPADVSVLASRPVLIFWPTARAGTTGTIVICSRRESAAARKVIVSQTGRPRVADPAAGECDS